MKKIRRFLLFLIVLIVLGGGALLWVFRQETATWMSLKQVNKYPFYTMTYSGDYGFDDFLKQGAHNDGDIEEFVTKRLLKGIPIRFHVTKGGCSAFTAKNSRGDPLYGRNFDFDYTPPLFLKTKPDHGYASISMVNLSFAGYTKSNLPKPQGLNSFLTMAAPYLPFDGMNEKGLTVALLAVPKAQPPKNPKQVTLNTTTAIRLMLDKAATVDEAVALLEKYNIYFSGGVNCHFLIEDAAGKSVLAEYWGNRLQVVKTKEKFQAATNFIAYKGMNLGEGYDEFQRYGIIHSRLAKTGGLLSEKDAMILLKQADDAKTQWSVVYNLKTLSCSVCIAKDFAHPYTFSLK